MKISNKILIANIAIVLIATVSTSGIALHVTKKEINRQVTAALNGRLKAFREILAPNGQKIQLVDGKLKAGETVLDGNNDAAEKMKDLFGGEATIFNHDLRVATTIKKEDGSRAVGTPLKGPAREAIVEKGNSYLGEAVVLGIPHFAAYMPIKDDSGAVIGALFVGERESDYLAVFDQLKYLTVCLSVILAAVLSLAGYLVLQRALVPLRNLIHTLHDVAEGDGNLTHRLQVGSDEIGIASGYFNTFIERVHSIVLNVADNTTSVASASAQLHGYTEKLAETADDVAAQTMNVSTAGEQMAATSSDISKSCMHAVESAQHACDMATVGVTDVGQTIKSMQAINDSVRLTSESVSTLGAKSEQIGDIISTIQDIADQTNLLALNAAIEAARAGEQGRGFAVVADEVRSLAERTTSATKEIENTIRTIQVETGRAVQIMQNSAREAAKGAEDSERSGKSLSEILEQINRVTQEIGQIAIAAEEQSATSHDISSNVHHITDMMQSAAKANRESMETADELNRLSASLKGQISRFNY